MSYIGSIIIYRSVLNNISSISAKLKTMVSYAGGKSLLMKQVIAAKTNSAALNIYFAPSTAYNFLRLSRHVIGNYAAHAGKFKTYLAIKNIAALNLINGTLMVYASKIVGNSVTAVKGLDSKLRMALIQLTVIWISIKLINIIRNKQQKKLEVDVSKWVAHKGGAQQIIDNKTVTDQQAHDKFEQRKLEQQSCALLEQQQIERFNILAKIKQDANLISHSILQMWFDALHHLTNTIALTVAIENMTKISLKLVNANLISSARYFAASAATFAGVIAYKSLFTDNNNNMSKYESKIIDENAKVTSLYQDMKKSLANLWENLQIDILLNFINKAIDELLWLTTFGRYQPDHRKLDKPTYDSQAERGFSKYSILYIIVAPLMISKSMAIDVYLQAGFSFAAIADNLNHLNERWNYSSQLSNICVPEIINTDNDNPNSNSNPNLKSKLKPNHKVEGHPETKNAVIKSESKVSAMSSIKSENQEVTSKTKVKVSIARKQKH